VLKDGYVSETRKTEFVKGMGVHRDPFVLQVRGEAEKF